MIVGETKCSCSNGCVVVIVAPDGTEYSTDANDSTDAEIVVWSERALERFKSLSTADRVRSRTAFQTVLRHAKVFERPCSECEGRGWLFRLHRDDSQADEPTSAEARAV